MTKQTRYPPALPYPLISSPTKRPSRLEAPVHTIGSRRRLAPTDTDTNRPTPANTDGPFGATLAPKCGCMYTGNKRSSLSETCSLVCGATLHDAKCDSTCSPSSGFSQGGFHHPLIYMVHRPPYGWEYYGGYVEFRNINFGRYVGDYTAIVSGE